MIGRTAVFGVATLFMGLGAFPAHAAPQAPACTVIGSIPYTISQPGTYCILRTLATDQESVSAISVEADDVTLDLRAHSLKWTNQNPGSDATGIAAYNRKNLTIVNGFVSGFPTGIYVGGQDDTASSGHKVARVRVRGSRSGIYVRGRRSIVRDCLVLKTAGNNDYAAGLAFEGEDGVVKGNKVLNTSTSPGGEASGISLTPSAGLIVEGNFVSTVSGATIIDPTLGLLENYGIRCGAPYASQNRVVGADIPFSDCALGPYPYPNPYPAAQTYTHPHLPRHSGAALSSVVAVAAGLLARFLRA